MRNDATLSVTRETTNYFSKIVCQQKKHDIIFCGFSCSLPPVFRFLLPSPHQQNTQSDKHFLRQQPDNTTTPRPKLPHCCHCDHSPRNPARRTTRTPPSSNKSRSRSSCNERQQQQQTEQRRECDRTANHRVRDYHENKTKRVISGEHHQQQQHNHHHLSSSYDATVLLPPRLGYGPVRTEGKRHHRAAQPGVRLLRP